MQSLLKISQIFFVSYIKIIDIWFDHITIDTEN